MSMSTRKAARRELKKQILDLSNGLLSTTTDLVLFNLYFGLSLFGKTNTTRGVHRAADEADELLAMLNYETFRNTFNNLKSRGFINTVRTALYKPVITKVGLSRVAETIPRYDTERIWDKMLYLINYDIPREFNSYSKQLSSLLKLVGCARLQHSLFITPYNPTGVLENFTEEKGSYGEILTSTLPPNSTIGEHKDIKDLLWKCYNLENANIGYYHFIEKYKDKKPKAVTRAKVALAFLSAVADDPQLPFELLKSDYLGDRAYILFQRLLQIKLPQARRLGDSRGI